jgi:hypothetical protein
MTSGDMLPYVILRDSLLSVKGKVDADHSASEGTMGKKAVRRLAAKATRNGGKRTTYGQ